MDTLLPKITSLYDMTLDPKDAHEIWFHNIHNKYSDSFAPVWPALTIHWHLLFIEIQKEDTKTNVFRIKDGIVLRIKLLK